MLSKLTLPFDGEVFASEHRTFDETVVFVHHFGGNKKSPARHIRLVNDLGFDAISFNLAYHDTEGRPYRELARLLPITGGLRFGAHHIWTEQIEAVLNTVPGRKVVFSFSGPSGSAAVAIAKRRAGDIAGLICDGGPFAQLARCLWNLYSNEFRIESRAIRALYTAASLTLYGFNIEREIPGILDSIPRDFPVLSIRGQKDTLVSEEAIDEFLDHTDHWRIERLTIEDAGHLEGYKMDALKYRESLSNFLRKVATTIEPIDPTHDSQTLARLRAAKRLRG